MALILQSFFSVSKLRMMLGLLIFLSSWFTNGQELDLLPTTPVNDGEVLEFRLSYGWFTVGRAKWYTDIQDYRGDECFKTRITARSSGLAGVFATVEDEWGEYAKTSDWMPKMAWRDLKEGRYILDEKTYFNYEDQKIRYETIKKGNKQPTKYIDMDKERVGMLSGFLQIRSVDFSKYKNGDEIKVEAFFEGEPYELVVVYKGVETLRSKVGRLKAHRVIPRLPENRLFPGKDPIEMWFSADMNQLPLRADARMSFGTAYVELTGYKNIKYGPDYD